MRFGPLPPPQKKILKYYIILCKQPEYNIWKAFNKAIIGRYRNRGQTLKTASVEGYVHRKLLDRFYIKPASARKDKNYLSRQQMELRRLKKNVKQHLKKVLTVGNKSQSACLRKDFLKLVRLHNKVGKLELKLKTQTYKANPRSNPERYRISLPNMCFKRSHTNRHPSACKVTAEKYSRKVNNDGKDKLQITRAPNHEH